MKLSLFFITLLILFHMAAFSETEPNNTMQQANNLAYNGSESGTLSGTDSEDWFVINIPQGGIFTLTVKKTGAGNGTLYLYDGEKTGNPEITNLYLNYGDSPEKGWILTAPLLSGKYYAKFLKGADSVNYQVTASLVNPSFVEDTEPNDTITTALAMTIDSSVSGTLHYYDAGKGYDLRDWYKITVTQGGILNLQTFKKGAGNGTIHFRDSKKAGMPEISSQYLTWGDSPAEGWKWSYPVLAGVYYFQVEGGDGVIDYKLDVSLTAPAFSEDMEPNDTVTEAIIMPVTGSVSGNIRYYVSGTGFDVQDWYKIDIPQGGILSLQLFKKGAGNGTLLFRDGKKAGMPEISSQYLDYGDSPAEGWKWSSPVLAGVYYFQVEGNVDIVDYKLDVNLVLPFWGEDQEPNDSLAVAKNLMVNDSVAGLLGYYKPGIGKDNWDWFLMKTSEYGYLSFNTDKKGNINGNIHLRDSVREIASQYLNFGDLNVVFGKLVPAGKYFLGFESQGDLQYKVRIKLTLKPKADFTYVKTDNSVTFENTTVEGVSYLWKFDDGAAVTTVNPFHEYQGPGNYDVCLISTNPVASDTTCKKIILPGVARIFPDKGGNTGDVTLQVFGGGLDTNFVARIMQGTSVVASSNLTAFADKSSILVRFDLRAKPVGTYDLHIEKTGGPSYTIPGGFTITEGKKADPWVSISGRDRILFNTWTTYTVNFGNNGNVDAVVVPVWFAFSQSPGLEVEFENMNIFNLDTLGIEPASEWMYVDLDSLFGQPFQARIYPLLFPVIGQGSIQSMKLRIKTGKNITINAWTEKPWFQSSINENKLGCIGDALAKVPEDLGIKDTIECVKFFTAFVFSELRASYKSPFTTVAVSLHVALKACGVTKKSDLKEISDWVTDVILNIYLNQAKPDSKSKSALKVFGGTLCSNEFIPQNLQIIPLTAVSSLDPNEKSGPAGYGTENYIASGRNFPYTIYFENKASATAPAHTVTITDQLDKTKFDFSSFSFGNAYVGDSLISIKSGLKEFVLDKKLDKLKVIARISGKLDTLSGKLEWKLRSLDPVTLDDIEDPDIGLLPPNKISPEGQGSVSFFVKLKTDPAHKSSVTNQASIVFDANPAIITNKHLTTFDLAAPQSAVESLSATTSARQFSVKWAGTDDGSGIENYNIYVKKNNDPYSIWLAGTKETSAVFKSPADGTFQFSSVAIDKTGNIETMSDNPDATTNVVTAVDEHGMPVPEVRVYPAPSAQELVVNIGLEGRFTLRVYGTDGRLRMGKMMNGNSTTRIQTGYLSRGLYLWQLVNDDISVKESGKFVVNE